jgi:excinuclease Cho
MNQKLRRNRQLCSIQLQAGVPAVVYSHDINFATTPDLYGLFPSRHAALEGLRTAADAARLCYGALGLEKLKSGRACFRAMLHQCAGVCRGDESPSAHHERLLASLEAMRVACWPFPGAIGLVERHAEQHENTMQIHVVRNWCYLGSVNDTEEAALLDTVAPGFDADGYRILCKPVLEGRVEVVDLSA